MAFMVFMLMFDKMEFHKIFVILMISLKSLICEEESVCYINNGNCTYKFTLSDKPKCLHGYSSNPLLKNHVLSKRSTDTQQNGGENLQEIDRLRKKMGKLEKKLSHSMDNLSSRVLRGVRRMEEKVNNLLNSHHKRNVITNGNEYCSKGFQKVDNWPYCYLMSKFNSSWYEARDFCSALESDLVALGTVKEHYLLTFLIKNDPELQGATGWWTSGSYVAKTKQWMWTAHLYTKPFTFIKWAPNEPNEESSQCVYLNRHDDHLWHDDLCTNRYNFICETMARSV